MRRRRRSPARAGPRAVRARRRDLRDRAGLERGIGGAAAVPARGSGADEDPRGVASATRPERAAGRRRCAASLQIGAREHQRRRRAARRDGDRQQPAHRRHAAIERQAADDGEATLLAVGQHARRGQNAERDRQVERRADLPHVGRREADGDALSPETEIQSCESPSARDRGSRAPSCPASPTIVTPAARARRRPRPRPESRRCRPPRPPETREHGQCTQRKIRRPPRATAASGTAM